MKSDSKPNILWISMEDTSPRFGCYGDPLARTPNIDRLAATGCRYPNAFSTAGVSAPSRAAIITGMYQTAIGAHHMRTTHQNRSTPEMPTPYSAAIPHYAKAFPEYLRAAGYYCTNNSKTDYQFTPPVTVWDELGNQAHWRSRAPGQPFFSVFNPTITHESGMWPENKTPPLTDPDSVKLPPWLPDTALARQTLAQHYDNIACSDRYIGELLSQLEQDGLAENTIVFLWSDHGEGLPRAKRWPYDAGIRIPLIVRWPGQLKPGSVDNALISLVDLGPTVLSLTHTPIPTHLHGQPFLGPRKAPPRKYIYATRDRHDEAYDMVRAVRDVRYKYIRNFRPELPYLLWIPYRNRHPIMQELWDLHLQDKLEGSQRLLFQHSRPPEELYDLEADPYELNNLADTPAYSSELARLRCELDCWRKTFGDMGELSEDEMVRQWYPQGRQPQTARVSFIPYYSGFYGSDTVTDGSYPGPVLLELHCPTQGASIAYSFEKGLDVKWKLYSGRLRLIAGEYCIRAKAIRYGYFESEERIIHLNIT